MATACVRATTSTLSTRERVEDCFDFTFLRDDHTINYFKKSKIMFILRGLPGSGKGALCNTMREIYPESVVCSADHYFLKDGQYQYNSSKISLAHKQCHQNAVEAVTNQAHVVIIENSNVRLWEMNFYLDLAKNSNYIPIIVEPKTSWKRDVNTLATKSGRNVAKAIIRSKSRNFEKIDPQYFGWFLNEKDSYSLTLETQDWFKKAFEIEDFRYDVRSFTGCKDIEGFQLFFTKPKDNSLLYCNAKYFSCYERECNFANLLAAEGQTFDIEIIGFVLTPRSIGARLKLTPEQKALWLQNDNQAIPSYFRKVTPMQFEDEENILISVSEELNKVHLEEGSREQNSDIPKYAFSVDQSCVEQTLTVTKMEQDQNKFLPTSGKGRRAHLVLAVAPGVSPSVTGLDLLFANNLEEETVVSNNNSSTDSSVCLKTITLDGATLKNYGYGVWVVYLEKKLVVSSVFAMKTAN